MDRRADNLATLIYRTREGDRMFTPFDEGESFFGNTSAASIVDRVILNL